MIVNWFSPLPPARTGIAEYTLHVLPALVAKAKVTLWTDAPNWDPSVEAYAPVRHYRPHAPPWTEINRADVSVYHVGNNLAFHSGILKIARAQPGIVVLHDLCLQHLIAGHYFRPGAERLDYLAQMGRHYGSRALLRAERLLTDVSVIGELAQSYPLSAPALEGALAVVVHFRRAADTLAATPAPVTFAPLPFRASATAGRPPGEDSPARPRRLIVFGFLSENRRLDTILNVLADLPQKDRFHLDVYGDLAHELAVRSRIDALSMGEHVTLHGFVPDEVLDRALARADLAINLRFPTMGEGSYSQLRIWDHALPSLATHVGWYSEQPPDAVGFVRPEQEAADLKRHLQAFLNGPETYCRMGERGRRLLQEVHRPESYVERLYEQAGRATSLRGCVLALAMARRAGSAMRAWLDPFLPDAPLARIARRLKEQLSR